ncbi:MAG: hypothetical protein AAF433_20745 [Bacteroidota bacterium]
MKNLKELVELVSGNKVKRIELLNLQEEPQSKINQLYRAVKEDQVSTDLEARALLMTNGQSAAAYSNLKTNLRKRLLNTLFFIDVDKRQYTDRQAAIFDIQKALAAAQLLQAKGAALVAAQQFERCLKIALKYEFVAAVLISCRALRLHYGTQQRIEKKFRAYDQLYRSYQYFDDWENRAEQYYADLIFDYFEKRRDTAATSQQAQLYFEELKEQYQNIATYKFRFYAALIQFIQYSCKNDFVPLIDLSQEVIHFFEQKDYQAHTPIQICLHHQIVGHLQLRNYDEGYQAARHSQKLITKGLGNWFNNQEFLLLLALHTEHYQEAYDYYQEATSHRRYSSLSKSVKGSWEVYRAYLHFLKFLERIHTPAKDRTFSTQKLNKFLNEKVELSKDKKGMNIAILILLIFFDLVDKNHEVAKYRLKTLKKYSYRHLQSPENKRPYEFVQLLLTLVEGNFQRKEVELRATPFLVQLKRLLGTEAASHKVEVIPFERMWEFALELLD